MTHTPTNSPSTWRILLSSSEVISSAQHCQEGGTTVTSIWQVGILRHKRCSNPSRSHAGQWRNPNWTWPCSPRACPVVAFPSPSSPPLTFNFARHLFHFIQVERAYCSVTVSKCSDLCLYHHSPVSDYWCQPSKIPAACLGSLPVPPAQPQSTLAPSSCLPTPGISRKGSHHHRVSHVSGFCHSACL